MTFLRLIVEKVYVQILFLLNDPIKVLHLFFPDCNFTLSMYNRFIPTLHIIKRFLTRFFYFCWYIEYIQVSILPTEQLSSWKYSHFDDCQTYVFCPVRSSRCHFCWRRVYRYWSVSATSLSRVRPNNHWWPAAIMLFISLVTINE